MEKFAKKIGTFPNSLVLLIIFLMSGCASTQNVGYISRNDHPYERKFYANFEKVTGAVFYVLKNQSWGVDSESDPQIYEQDDRYQGNGYKNLLIITSQRNSFHLLYSSKIRLNIFIHSLGGSSDVEIRYESRASLHTSMHNDKLVNDLLDDIQNEVER